MSVFYKRNGPDKTRAGVYRRFVNSGRKRMIENFTPPDPDREEKVDDKITYAFDGGGNVLLNIPGINISWDGKGNVLITGLNARVAYNNGNVNIGE